MGRNLGMGSFGETGPISTMWGEGKGWDEKEKDERWGRVRKGSLIAWPSTRQTAPALIG